MRYEPLRNHKLLKEKMRQLLNKYGVEKTFLIMTQKPEP